MSRSPRLDPDRLAAEQRAVYDEIVSGPRGGLRGPFPALLQVAELARRVAQLGDQIRFHSQLPARLAEVAILTVAEQMRCEYEGYAHARLAREAGVSGEVIAAILEGQPSPPFVDDDQRLVHRYALKLLHDHRVEDALHLESVAILGDRGTLELVATIAYFRMVATLLNAYAVEIPEGAGSPFDGREGPGAG